MAPPKKAAPRKKSPAKPKAIELPTLSLPEGFDADALAAKLCAPNRPKAVAAEQALQDLITAAKKSPGAKGFESGKGAWEKLVSDGVVESTFPEATCFGSPREFSAINHDCPGCSAMGTWRNPYETVHQPDCQWRIWPADLSSAFLIASDPDGVLLAERLAKQLISTLVPFGVRPPTRLSWYINDLGPYPLLSYWEIDPQLEPPLTKALEAAYKAARLPAGIEPHRIIQRAWPEAFSVKRGETTAQAKARVRKEAKAAQPHLYKAIQTLLQDLFIEQPQGPKQRPYLMTKVNQEDLLFILMGAAIWEEARKKKPEEFAKDKDPFFALLSILALGYVVHGLFEDVLVLFAAPVRLS